MNRDENKSYLAGKGIESFYPLIPFIASFLLYARTLGHGFVYDDGEQVLNNPWLSGLESIPKIFISAAWDFSTYMAGSNYYRPIMHISFLLEKLAFGLTPWAFHMVNILLHSVNSLLVFITARLIFKALLEESDQENFRHKTGLSPAYPLLAALIFALHPINSEVASWVSALPELTFTLFGLIAFIIHIKAGSESNIPLRILSAAFFLLALLSKETGAAFFLIILAFDYSLRGRYILRRWSHYLPYIAAFSIYLTLRFYALSGLAGKKMIEITPWESIINVAPLLTSYLWKLLVPVNLSVIYPFEPASYITEARTLGSLLVLALFIALIIYFRKRRTLFFTLLWIVIPLLPILYLPVVSVGGFADRYLYLPSAAFAILISYISIEAGSKTSLSQRKRFLQIFFLCLLTLYALGSVSRAGVWKDNFTLWSDTVKKAPESSLVQASLASAYYDAGKTDLALVHYTRAIELEPGNFRAHYNLALIYEKSSSLPLAVKHYRLSVYSNPLFEMAHFNLAIVYNKSGQRALAINSYKEVIKVNPANYRAYSNLAWLFMEEADYSRAVASFKNVLRYDPSNLRATGGLAMAYHGLGDWSRATPLYKATIRANPDDFDARYNLATIYSVTGRNGEAIAELSELLRLYPAHSEARIKLRQLQQ